MIVLFNVFVVVFDFNIVFFLNVDLVFFILKFGISFEIFIMW